DKDFSAIVSKIKASGADLVYWGGLHTEGGLLVRQMRDQGVATVIMSGDGITSDEFATIGGAGGGGGPMTHRPPPRREAAGQAAEAKGVVEKVPQKNFGPGAIPPQQPPGGQDNKGGGESRNLARSKEYLRDHQTRPQVPDGDRRAQL